MKNFLWILFTTGLLLFSCSSSENITSNDENVRLPGMPADEGSAAIIEADGLIGVEPGAQYTEFFLFDSIRVVVDDPYDTEGILDSPLNLIIYALPNGNSIEWTMGKQKNAADNWHFNIQYVDAQAEWLRQHTSDRYVVAYLEAPKLSWPAWKKSHPDHGEMISHMFDSLRAMYPHARVLLNSHSGGGSLINGFIETRDALPAWVKRISFIGSNY